jgi:hypothetical protein
VPDTNVLILTIATIAAGSLLIGGYHTTNHQRAQLLDGSAAAIAFTIGAWQADQNTAITVIAMFFAVMHALVFAVRFVTARSNSGVQ